MNTFLTLIISIASATVITFGIDMVAHFFHPEA
jgi:hypothetical protein